MQFTLFAVTALFAGLSVAQDLTALNNLPPCGKTCITNMLNKAGELGCSNAANTTCLCTNKDFGNGIRDCTNESCPPNDRAPVLQFGQQFCAAVLASGKPGVATVTTGVSTVTSVISTGSATVVVSTGTDSTGGAFTTTLGSLGAVIPPTGVVETITGTNTAGSAYTSTVTITGTSSAGNGTSGNSTGGVGGVGVVTTTDSHGSTVTATTTTGLGVVTSTASGGSVTTFTTTATGGAASASATSTSSGMAGHLMVNGVVGAAAGLLVALL